MTVSQKRAIGYKIRQKERQMQYSFLMIKGLLAVYNNSRYKSMIWFIRSKGLEEEYEKFRRNNGGGSRMTEGRKAVKKIAKKLGLVFEHGEIYTYFCEDITITAYDDCILIDEKTYSWCITIEENDSAESIYEKIVDTCGRYIGLEAVE